MVIRTLFCSLAILAASGCATVERLFTEPRVEAGADPLAQLQSLNEFALAQAGEGLCTEHVAAATDLVARLDGYDSLPIYSCPRRARAQGVCHVALLVTAPDGARWVLDNGSVADDALGVSHVASFADYAERLGNVYWIGLAPDWDDIRAAVPDFPREPSDTVFALR